MSKKGLISFISLFSIGIVLVLSSLFMIDFDYKKLSFVATYTKIEKSFDATLNSSIILECESEDIIVEQTEDTEIKLVYFVSSKNKYSLTEKNGVITLSFDDRTWSDYFEVNLKEKYVKLFIPENYSGNIDIYNRKGEISIQNVENASKIFISGEDSDILIENTEVKDLFVENLGGDVLINNLNSSKNSGSVYIKTQTGNIEIKDVNILQTNSSLNLETKSGRIKLENIVAYNVAILSNEGNIDFVKLKADVINVETGIFGIVNGEIVGNLEDYFIVVKGGINNTIESSLGSIEDTTLTKFLTVKVFNTSIKIAFTQN